MTLLLSIALGVIVVLAYTIRLLVQALNVKKKDVQRLEQTNVRLTKERDGALTCVELVLENERKELGEMSSALEMVLNGT